MQRRVQAILAISVMLTSGTMGNGAKAAPRVPVKVAEKPALLRLRYRVTDLGLAGSSNNAGGGIVLNNRGDAVTTMGDGGGGPDRVYLWRAGRRTHLHLPDGYNRAVIESLNDEDVCAGGVFDVDPDDTGPSKSGSPGIIWSNGRIREVEGQGDLVSASVVGVSDDGSVLLSCSPSDADIAINGDQHITRAYLITGQTVKDLGQAEPIAINSAGEILANRPNEDDPETTHPAVYVQGAWRDLPGLRGYEWMRAAGNNDAGDVCGYAWNGNMPDHPEAYLYHAGQMIDLGPGNPNGVNDSGEVVGDRQGHPVLWWRGGLTYLNRCLDRQSGWVVLNVQGINNRGQIAGFARRNRRLYAVLLTPVPGTGHGNNTPSKRTNPD